MAPRWLPKMCQYRRSRSRVDARSDPRLLDEDIVDENYSGNDGVIPDPVVGALLDHAPGSREQVEALSGLTVNQIQDLHELTSRKRALETFRSWRADPARAYRKSKRDPVREVTENGRKAYTSLVVEPSDSSERSTWPKATRADVRMLGNLSRSTWHSLCELAHRLYDAYAVAVDDESAV